MDGTLLAHVEGGVPNLIVHAGAIDARTCGELIYFFWPMEWRSAVNSTLAGKRPLPSLPSLSP